ncbi:MAG: hypothetical protein H6R01_1796 [Burkholderiaceae bacterium]|nr:hypothetical protein [Burkholderiaceae bacterium]
MQDFGSTFLIAQSGYGLVRRAAAISPLFSRNADYIATRRMTMPEISLQSKIAFLSMPSNYPERPMDVNAIETHMSWVFLTDRFAYKMKKPVIHDYLDFSTLAARRRFCEEEVRLNCRLAENVYLGVLPLTLDAAGALEFAGEGQVAEWLILMRRLNGELALDHCISNRRVAIHALEKLGEKLARFYVNAQAERITAQQYRQRFAAGLDEIFAELSKPEYELPPEMLNAIAQAMRAFLIRRAALFDGRVNAGRIIEGHADLRAEHVYLENEPVIVDCLEFSKDLRTVDAAGDLSFLALECERLGATEIGDLLFEIYRVTADDHPPEELVHYYQAYHACSRARIALWHLKEPQYHDSIKWPLQAKEWLRLAALHVEQLK